MNLDELFRKKTEEIVYLKLKTSTEILDREIPMPLLKKDLIKGIQQDKFEQEISFEYFYKGMIYNIAIDVDFRYVPQYIEIMKTAIKDVYRDVFIKGLHAEESEKIYYFRCNYLMKDPNLDNMYYYALALNQQAIRDEKNKSIYSDEALRILNEMIQINPKYPLSYLELGNMEVEKHRYIKAYQYYELADENLRTYDLNEKSKDLIQKDLSMRKKEIQLNRDLLLSVEYADRNKLNESNEILEKLLRSNDAPIIKYYLGRNYFRQNKLQESEMLLQKAYEQGYEDIVLFIDYSYLLALLGKTVEALNMMEKALTLYPDEERILYNRAMIYLNLGKVDLAKKDIDTILSYDDTDEQIYNNAMIIKNKLEENDVFK